MLAKRIIPCLDVNAGRVVKGTNFVNLRDAGDPVEVAARYEEEGADELVFLDITASHEGREIIWDVVRRTAEVCFMPLTVGGGIRDARRHPGPAERRGRQGLDQLGGGPRPRVRPQRRRGGSAASASSSTSTRSGSTATAARSGRSTSTAAGSRPGWRRSPGPARSSGSGPARSS